MLRLSRLCWPFAVLAGCAFPAASGVDGEGDGGDAGDGSPPADAAPPVPRACDDTDPDLRLCLEFEDEAPFTTTSDGSMFAHEIELSAVGVMARAEQQAADLGAESRLVVAEDPELDVAQITMAMWMRPAQLPANGKSFWLLDNNTQYALSYQPSGALRCVINGQTVDTPALAPDEWRHVACSFDGTRMVVYVDGTVAACRGLPAQALRTDGTVGTAIGANHGTNGAYDDRFLGGLDSVRIHARALAAAEVCQLSGFSDCTATCP